MGLNPTPSTGRGNGRAGFSFPQSFCGGPPMPNETIPEQLQRTHDLIDETISIIEDLREGSLYKPSLWFAYAETHARAAKRGIRKELSVMKRLAANVAAAI